MARKASATQEAADGTAIFVSRFPRYKIHLDKPTAETLPGGRVHYTAGRSVQFERGRFSTADPDLIQRLRAARGYGRGFQEIVERT